VTTPELEDYKKKHKLRSLVFCTGRVFTVRLDAGLVCWEGRGDDLGHALGEAVKLHQHDLQARRMRKKGN
jgi:hypothetical protein